MSLDLEAVKAREVRATEGPWEAYSSESTMNDRSEWRIGDRSKPQVARSVMRQADAEFIAHARQDIPALLAYIGELEDQLGAVRALVGPENESGMISADAIFHTIGTSNQGGE